MKEIIYIKEVSNYDDLLKKQYKKMPLFIKKIIFLYKNIFNLITKKYVEGNNIWILPLKDKYSENKINNIFKKIFTYKDKIYLPSNELKNKQIYKIMDKYNINYITEEKIKKILLIKTLKYICNIQKKDLNTLELTILVNDASELNLYIIEELAKIVKTLKIVSLNIYKFKKIEEKMYNEYGIAIQFSNSYKKSLEKSENIINFDFNQIEVNEYEIYNRAIVINCLEKKIKIKSRLFNGIVINSYNIDFNKDIINRFKKINIYEDYDKLMLYASIIEQDICKIYKQLEEDNVTINNLIGNNGIINKKEFKNIVKKLDKNKKTE